MKTVYVKIFVGYFIMQIDIIRTSEINNIFHR
jgi:hypothetical protein